MNKISLKTFFKDNTENFENVISQIKTSEDVKKYSKSFDWWWAAICLFSKEKFIKFDQIADEAYTAYISNEKIENACQDDVYNSKVAVAFWEIYQVECQ